MFESRAMFLFLSCLPCLFLSVMSQRRSCMSRRYDSLGMSHMSHVLAVMSHGGLSQRYESCTVAMSQL